MRPILLPGTDLVSSPLGMGCASLGSRYSGGVGLRALDAAFDHGVRWFDIAPAYGGGEAEAIFAGFLKGKRESVLVCTKVGAVAPRQSMARRLIMPVARPLVARAKWLRGSIRKSGVTANTYLAITGSLIEQSIARSLSRLGTDRVDVFALHNPAPDALMRDDVLRAMERTVERGQARHIAIAGDLEADLAGARCGRYAVIQVADDPATDPLEQIRAAATGPIATISHSILGASGAAAHLSARLHGMPDVLNEARDSGFGEQPDEIAAALLMTRAFEANRDGVVLASMFGKGHLTTNLAAASQPATKREMARVLVARAMRSGFPPEAPSDKA